METTGKGRLLRLAQRAATHKTDGAEEGAEGGFTLIELMVVLLIMAILLAIAIPTFLGVKGSAQDRSAQSDLTNGITAAKAYFTNQGSYATVSATILAALTSSEPELSWTTGSVTSPHGISIANSATVMLMVSRSQTGRCWYAEDNNEASSGSTGGVPNATSQQGVFYAELGGNNGTCSAGTGPTATTWASSYPAPT